MKNTILKIGLIGIATLALTACPSKSSKSPAVIGQTCVNCGVQQTAKVPFGQNLVSNISQGSLNLSLSVDATQLNYWTSRGQNPIFAYVGEALVGGSLNLTEDLFMGLCRLPAGQYQITSFQSGAYNMGVFQFPTVTISSLNTAVGAVTMTATLVEGVILTDGMGQIRGMSALLYAQSGLATFNQWNGGRQIACQDSVGVRF